jgi:glycerophosphoryl diester phosphodiesterase
MGCMTRRELFGAAIAGSVLQLSGVVSKASAQSFSYRDEKVYLAAHRGGIVDEQHPENSEASIRSAIDSGYWMIEVDVRATRDGEPILQHDPTFQRYFDDPRRPEDMSLAEVQRLRSTPGNRAPIHFDEMCAMAEGKLRLMLDLKGQDFPKPYLQRIEDAMRRHGLLEGSCTLGGGTVKQHFDGKVLLSAGREALRQSVAKGDSVASRYFLFELGSVMDQEAVTLCQQHGVLCMAAINTFRYEMAKVDHWQGAQADIERLLALGVRHFQIDSIYDKFVK